MYIDFTELAVNGIHLELLVQELLQYEGLEVHWEGVGQDNGKDLVVVERVSGVLGTYKNKWVVQCKHTAHGGRALSSLESYNIRDTCDMVGAEGYLLVCTTYLSAKLIEKLDMIANQHKLAVNYWDALELEKRLLKPACFSLIERFFPRSAERIGCKVYSSTEPSKWLATYKAHLFNLSCRLSNYYPSIKLVENIINVADDFYLQYNREKQIFYTEDVERLNAEIDYLAGQDMLTPEDFSDGLQDSYLQIRDYEYIRVRSIWYDDIYGNFRVDADYLYDGPCPLMDLKDFKEYFHEHNYVVDFEDDEDEGEYYISWNFYLCRASFRHDHFSPNHAEYYDDLGGHGLKGKAFAPKRIQFDIDRSGPMSMGSFEEIVRVFGL